MILTFITDIFKENGMTLWIIFLVGVIALYFAAMIWALPKLFLKSKYLLQDSYDRGIKRYRLDSDGYAIVYEPQLKIRKYIKQYVITERHGQKTFMCKIEPEIFFLDFEVFLFDSCNKVFEVINIRDMIEKDGYTREVEIPADTAYVTIMLNQVDNDVISRRASVKISGRKMAGFWLWSILLSAVFALLLKFGIANLIGGVFRQSIMLSLLGNLQIIAVAVAVDIVYMTILTFVWKRNKK